MFGLEMVMAKTQTGLILFIAARRGSKHARKSKRMACTSGFGTVGRDC
jgi:hypothetical protein